MMFGMMKLLTILHISKLALCDFNLATAVYSVPKMARNCVDLESCFRQKL